MLEKLKESFTGLFSKPIENFQNHVTKWVSHGRMGGLLEYRSSEFTELTCLKAQYDICFSKDQKAVEGILKTQDGGALTLLDIDWEKQKPFAGTHEILMSFNYNDKQNRGFLKKEMRLIANLIKACVNARFLANETQGYNHVNGAVVLFCAEFSLWVNGAAKLPADTKLESELHERVDYLSRIEEEAIFKNEPKADYAVNLLIFNLQQILERAAIPKLQARIRQEASREIFESLTTSAGDFYENATKGLFYLYTIDTACQDVFDIEHEDIIVNETKEKYLATPLGEQFRKLEDMHKKAERLNYQDNKLKSIAQNPFLDEKGESLSSLTAKLFLGNSGIHPLLEKQTIAIRHLLSGLGLLQDFTWFMSAFKQGFQLAGIGGNILMYIGLCQQTTQLIQCYCEIHNRLINQFSEVQKLGDNIKYGLMLQQEYNHPWIQNYQRGKRYLRQAQDNLISCYEFLQKMAIQMKKVYSQSYEEEVKKQMEWFDHTISIISQRFGKAAIHQSPSDEINISEKSEKTIITTSSSSTISTKSIEKRREEALWRHDQWMKMGDSSFILLPKPASTTTDNIITNAVNSSQKASEDIIIETANKTVADKQNNHSLK